MIVCRPGRIRFGNVFDFHARLTPQAGSPAQLMSTMDASGIARPDTWQRVASRNAHRLLGEEAP
jgi:hypothetical protein